MNMNTLVRINKQCGEPLDGLLIWFIYTTHKIKYDNKWYSFFSAREACEGIGIDKLYTVRRKLKDVWL